MGSGVMFPRFAREATVTAKSWANLVKFRDRFPERDVTGVCLHAGDGVGRIDGWLHVLPITSLWRH